MYDEAPTTNVAKTIHAPTKVTPDSPSVAAQAGGAPDRSIDTKHEIEDGKDLLRDNAAKGIII